MSKGKILVLVEGARIDLRLMERMLNIYGIDKQHQIVSYNTNIYSLYNTMFRDTDPADLDILAHLRSHEPDLAKKNLFSARFSDILLVFDLDPQDPHFSADKIIEMSKYFVESTDMGKLYLNYPMIEAFYHMKSIPDADYNAYVASLTELKSGNYKSRVNAENRNHDYTKFAVNRAECNIVIRQNSEKAWLIAKTQQPSTEIDYPPPNSTEILKKQIEKLLAENVVAVLCTCVFYIIDYDPKLLRMID